MHCIHIKSNTHPYKRLSMAEDYMQVSLLVPDVLGARRTTRFLLCGRPTMELSMTEHKL